jgi:methylglyoxal synthase
MEMTIALIAHDSKKELMVQFCIAYCGILSKHELCATGTTGKLVAEATGLNVQRFLTGKQGGDQQIGARITYNEIDMVLFFRDPISSSTVQDGDVTTLMRLCDLNNVPMATNVATAEMLVLGLERGDLDWRKNIRQGNSLSL